MVVKQPAPRTRTAELLGPLMASYVDDAAKVLKREDRPVGRIVVAPSPVTWDGDKDGMLWIRLVSLVPQQVSGVSAGSYDPCGPSAWTVNLALGVIRCIATLDPRGRPPSADAVTDDGLQQLADVLALKDVIEGNPKSRAFQQWNPLQPQGGFAGGEWVFSSRIDNVFTPLLEA